MIFYFFFSFSSFFTGVVGLSQGMGNDGLGIMLSIFWDFLSLSFPLLFSLFFSLMLLHQHLSHCRCALLSMMTFFAYYLHMSRRYGVLHIFLSCRVFVDIQPVFSQLMPRYN